MKRTLQSDGTYYTQIKRLQVSEENVTGPSSSAVVTDISDASYEGLSTCGFESDREEKHFTLTGVDDTEENEIKFASLDTADNIRVLSPVLRPVMSALSVSTLESCHNSPVDGISSKNEEDGDTPLSSSKMDPMTRVATPSICHNDSSTPHCSVRPMSVRELFGCDDQPATLQHLTTLYNKLASTWNDSFEKRLSDTEADHRKYQELLENKVRSLEYTLEVLNAASNTSSAFDICAASGESRNIVADCEWDNEQEMANFSQRLPIRTAEDMAAMDKFLEMYQTAFLQHVTAITSKNIEDDYSRLKAVYNSLFDAHSLFKEYTYAGKKGKLPLIKHRTITETNKLLRAAAVNEEEFDENEGKFISKWLANFRDQDRRKAREATHTKVNKNDKRRIKKSMLSVEDNVSDDHELNNRQEMENFLQRLPIRTAKDMAAMDKFLEMYQTAFLQHVTAITSKNITDDYSRIKVVYNSLFEPRTLCKEYTYAGKGEKLALIKHKTVTETNKLLRVAAVNEKEFDENEKKFISKWLANFRDQDRRKAREATDSTVNKNDKRFNKKSMLSDEDDISNGDNNQGQDKKDASSKHRRTNADITLKTGKIHQIRNVTS